MHPGLYVVHRYVPLTSILQQSLAHTFWCGRGLLLPLMRRLLFELLNSIIYKHTGICRVSAIVRERETQIMVVTVVAVVAGHPAPRRAHVPIIWCVRLLVNSNQIYINIAHTRFRTRSNCVARLGRRIVWVGVWGGSIVPSMPDVWFAWMCGARSRGFSMMLRRVLVDLLTPIFWWYGCFAKNSCSQCGPQEFTLVLRSSLMSILYRDDYCIPTCWHTAAIYIYLLHVMRVSTSFEFNYWRPFLLCTQIELTTNFVFCCTVVIVCVGVSENVICKGTAKLYAQHVAHVHALVKELNILNMLCVVCVRMCFSKCSH